MKSTGTVFFSKRMKKDGSETVLEQEA